MRTSLFDYDLPAGSVAQRPLAKRDASRMLVLDRKTGRIEHSWVKDLPQWMLPGDLMVVNTTKVLPARLEAVKPGTGAKLEIFLLRKALGEKDEVWEALVAPAKRVKGNPSLKLLPTGEAQVLESIGEGHFLVRFSGAGPFTEFLARHGHMPLPPYIKRSDSPLDRERYQTLFAKEEGSVAAPTAGLHFTKALMENLKKRGVQRTEVLLHVGLGTFLPVLAQETESHVMHPERVEVPVSAVEAVARARGRGGRVVAVGTTVVRALESASASGTLMSWEDETRLFIEPGYRFRAVDVLFTNFHQPKSTLLMLVSAFAGRERVLAAYQEAVREGYRFLSYGDAMLIL